jgi:hypothetical protein
MIIHEEVPASAARFFGHVCGVIAVAMAAVSAWGLWHLGSGVAHDGLHVGFGAFVAFCIGLTALFFRWAGVMTGHWATHGRLSVPPSVYVAFGVLCAGVSAVGVCLLLTQTLTLPVSLALAAGTIGGGMVAYWCRLLLQRRR